MLHQVAGADQEALAHLQGQAAEDKTAGADSTAAAMTRAANPVNFNMGTWWAPTPRSRAMLDEVASMPGVKGIMLTFDDFLKGMDDFGTRIQPLMECRPPPDTGARQAGCTPRGGSPLARLARRAVAPERAARLLPIPDPGGSYSDARRTCVTGHINSIFREFHYQTRTETRR
jgi:hypothetical protein